jgi:hypothetical protein
MSVAARNEGSFVVAGTLRGASRPFTFGALSLDGPSGVDSGFFVDAARLSR